MPSIGRFADASTGTSAMMLPPGMPGTVNELRTEVNAIDASCADRQRQAVEPRDEQHADRHRHRAADAKHRCGQRQDEPGDDRRHLRALRAFDHRRQRRQRRPRRERHRLRGRAQGHERAGDMPPRKMPTGYSSSGADDQRQRHDEADIRHDRGRRRQSQLRRKRHGQREHADRRKRQNPADQPLHGVRQCLPRRAARCRAGPPRTPDSASANSTANTISVSIVPSAGGLEDVLRHEIDDPLTEAGRAAPAVAVAVSGPRSAIAAA